MAENIYIFFYSAIKYLLLCCNTQFITIHNMDSPWLGWEGNINYPFPHSSLSVAKGDGLERDTVKQEL